MTSTAQLLQDAREAFARGEWHTACEHLSTVDRAGALDLTDLDLFSRAAWWLGDGVTAMSVSETLYRRLLEAGDRRAAARRALALTLAWATRGDAQVALGWQNRARRLVEQLPRGPEHGYLRYVEAGITLDIEGDPEPARAASAEIRTLAQEFDDPALPCFALVLSGMAAVREGRTAAGFGDLDEAMLPVLAGEVPPLYAGDIYCTVIHACEALGDLARMRTWTDALQRWAEPLSRTFLYAGVTRVHQLQLISAEGDWDQVERELAEQSEQLVGSHGWLAGIGYHELGEVRRLRGDRDGALAAYDLARRLGTDPQPGAALQLAADGRAPEALADLRAALAGRDRLGRARLLLPAVEVGLEAGDTAYAAVLADELEATAMFYDSGGLRARASQARALLQLRSGEAAQAVPLLQSAARTYREQRFQHASARVHELLAVAHRERGELAAAEADRATAVAIYRRLGAGPDLRRLAPEAVPGGLTPREVQILACVASGASNRAVADHLVISEKTVSRHLANIFLKIGVGSRTAAAAWARDHGIAPTAAP